MVSKRLLIAIISRRGNVMDCLMKLLNIPVTFNNSLAPAVNYINTKTQVKFDDSCLKQDKVTFIHKKVENIFLVYEINMLPFNVGKDFAFKYSLF